MTKRVPTSVKVGGKRVRVRVILDLESWGEYLHDEAEIHLAPRTLLKASTLRETLRHELMHAALRDRRLNKSQKSVDIVGCGWGELRDYLESKFTDGMTWDNMNLWHVDHIIPLVTAKTEEQVLALCHYSNLQPLWAADNLSKSTKLNYQHTRS
jgi:hypothetical protein